MRAGERLDGEGLGQAGHAFEQDVAVGEQADEQAVDQPVLAHEHAAHFLFHGGDPSARGGDPFLQFFSRHEWLLRESGCANPIPPVRIRDSTGQSVPGPWGCLKKAW